MITVRLQQPLFVIPKKRNNATIGFASELEDSFDTSPAIRTAVNIISQKHDGVVVSDLRSNPRYQVVECGQVAVDVADRHDRHQTKFGSSDTSP